MNLIRRAEWAPKKSLFLAWPYGEDLWGEDLPLAQKEFLQLCRALKDEPIKVCVPNSVERQRFQELTFGQFAGQTLRIPYGDIWLRDIGPIFVQNARGQNHAVIPRFNGWGKKYCFPDDLDFARRLACGQRLPTVFSSLVFEGGAIECNGAGVLLTTKRCLQNPSRNPFMSPKIIEGELCRLFGCTKVIWLERGLKNDHTDGHVDTLARFIDTSSIAIMTPESKNDPNADVFWQIEETLFYQANTNGQRFRLVKVPSPGAVVNDADHLMPASYLNFIIGTNTIVIPTYGTENDEKAVRIIASCFPKLKTVGIHAKGILAGGGAFHCLSQEEPW